MKLELRRQFMHFLFGSAIIALVTFLEVQKSLFVLITLFITGLVFSFAIKKGAKIPVISAIVKKVERNYEKHLPGKGALLFFLGAIITIILFQEKTIVLGALCTVVYGDSASTVFGKKFGKHIIAGKRTWEGTIAGFLAALFFLSFLFPLQIAIITALIGMLAELLPFDDNFTIPIAAGIALKALAALA